MENPTRAIRSDELLAQMGWVRGLARRLARDANEAEDLAQETLLKALEKPPRTALEGPGLRAWLARVTRTLARQSARGDERRRRREHVAAGSNAVHERSTFDVVERASQQQELVHHVLALDEPYRSTVLYRYLDGHRTEEIARRMGVEPATVRKRLSRGFALLRERVDGAHASRRDARVWLLALASPRNAEASLVPTALSLGGILAVSTKLKLAVVVVGALIALVTWRVVDRPAGEAGPAPVVEASGLSLAAEPPALARTPAPRAEGARERRVIDHEQDASVPAGQNAAAASPALRVQARILDGEQQPLPWASLSLIFFRIPRERRYVNPRPAGGECRAVVDAEGAAVLELETLPENVDVAQARIHVVVQAPGQRPEHFEHAFPRDGTLDLGRVILEPFFGVVGRVVDERRMPLAGVSVRALRPSFDVRGTDLAVEWPYPHGGEASTDENGIYHLDRLEAGLYRIWAGDGLHAGQLSEALRIGSEDPAHELDFVLADLPPENLLSGVVTDTQGNPLRNMDLLLDMVGEPRQFEEWGKTDAQGLFTFAMQTDRRFDLRVSDPGREFTSATLEGLAPGGPRLSIRLQPARRFEISVTDEQGTPVSPYRIAVRPVGEAFASFYEEGEFPEGRVLAVVPDRPFVVVVDATAYGLSETGPLSPDRSDDLHVALQPLARISGRVTAEGEPVASAKLTLFAENLENEDFRLGVASPMRAETDVEGRFSLPIQYDARYSLLARADGYAESNLRQLQLSPQRPEEVELELGSGGAIEGRVSVPPGEDPGGRTVELQRGWILSCRTATDPDGFYRIEGLSPGPWIVTVARDNRAAPPLIVGARILRDDEPAEPDWNCEVFEGETTVLDLTIEPLAELAGSFRVDGEPLGELGLRLYTREHPWFSEGWQTATPSVRAATDPEGVFELKNAEAGHFWLIANVATGPLAGLTWVRAIELGPGANHIEVELETTRVSGQVPLATADAPANLLTRLDQNTFALTAVSSNTDGAFSEAIAVAGPTRLVQFGEGAVRADPDTWFTLGQKDLSPGVPARFDP